MSKMVWGLKTRNMNDLHVHCWRGRRTSHRWLLKPLEDLFQAQENIKVDRDVDQTVQQCGLIRCCCSTCKLNLEWVLFHFLLDQFRLAISTIVWHWKLMSCAVTGQAWLTVRHLPIYSQQGTCRRAAKQQVCRLRRKEVNISNTWWK